MSSAVALRLRSDNEVVHKILITRSFKKKSKQLFPYRVYSHQQHFGWKMKCVTKQQTNKNHSRRKKANNLSGNGELLTSTSPVFSQHHPATRLSPYSSINGQIGSILNTTVRQRIRIVIEIQVYTSISDKLMLIHINWYTCRNEGLFS